MIRALAITRTEYFRHLLAERAHALVDFLYGDEQRSNRTLALAALALALSFILQSTPAHACAV